MAITQTGSTTFINPGPGTITLAASGTVTGITVPGDAEIMLLGVSAYSAVANRISANGTFDIGGNTSVGVGGAANNTLWESALHYILLPATGTQDLDWQWGGGAGAALDESSLIVCYSFWKGIDTASPVRDSGGAQAAADTATTPTLTAQSGDLIVAVAGTFDAVAGDLTFSFSGSGGAAVLDNVAQFSNADMAIGTASPTGDQTITATATGAEEFSISAFVLKAATSLSVLPIFSSRSNALLRL